MNAPKAAKRTANTPLRSDLQQELLTAFRDNALPGEDDGFDNEACAIAAQFMLKCAAVRKSDEPVIHLQSGTAPDGHRRLLLGIVNDDKPFLVDSTAAIISGFGLAIERLIHPVVMVERDADGGIIGISPHGEGTGRAESMIYIELERADAKTRNALLNGLTEALADVGIAVKDWLKLQAALEDAASDLPDGEGAALLQWFLDRNLTLLAHEVVDADGSRSQPLGVSRRREQPLLSSENQKRARKWFRDGKAAPLIIKSNQLSTVHRRVLMDLIITPLRDGGDVSGLKIIAGLWTSSALATPPDKVPVLRSQMAQLFDKLGFSPNGHAGKAFAHALTSLPHDLLINFSRDDLEQLALTAISLLDRPRSKLHCVQSPLARHLLAFVWLPRDQMSTQMRKLIEQLLIDATNAKILNWSNTLDESGVAMLRYTLDLGKAGHAPDVAKLDLDIANLVRGWRPAVEGHLAESTTDSRGAVLAQRYADAFPSSYRNSYGADEAARDILRLFTLERGAKQATRLYRLDSDQAATLRLKIYHLGGPLPLSDAVPTLENFGFSVFQEFPTPLDEGRLGYIHDFVLHARNPEQVGELIERAEEIERAINNVLQGAAENDAFNQLLTTTGIDFAATVWFRAWFRYLRQIGVPYGIATIVEALSDAPEVTRKLVDQFRMRHDPAAGKSKKDKANALAEEIDAALVAVTSIDDDRILNLFRKVSEAVLRTNAFASAGQEALAFKLDSAAIPDLPHPVPWREIFVYSPRVEGIHLRAGPIARGGLRWSDRRDDFRTEILGLMKAQRVKNAVIVPTGAKGGFFPKNLNAATDRDAYLEEGTAAYCIFIRALLSVTDNIVDHNVVHPADVVVHDGNDPYFVVAADKGTASFSDIANKIAVDQNFWLGDAFASGGSQGYDHKAMGITARGAWISVQRHFAEQGVDVQKDPVRVVGVGDMSGDVFGNGMLLSKSLKLVAAFDHRHIFIDPDPDPANSWKERKRLFDLPRSSWDDFDRDLLSAGGAVIPRQSKSIELSKEAAAMLGIDPDRKLSPTQLLKAILTMEADLLWFGGIGTYVKAAAESNGEVGDPANDLLRANAEDLKAKVVGEGANLGITQAARIAFARDGGAINTDFIDNSAGVDCSDNEVNIKIAFNAAMAAGSLERPARNALLTAMTDDVAALVLADNRLQALGLSIAQSGGVKALPSYIRLIDSFEEQGQLARAVEGLASSDELARRAQDKRGLTRPELAVLVATAKLALQSALEADALGKDDAMETELLAAFPDQMVKEHKDYILSHQLRGEIVATKVANRMINRLGLIHPFELAEEEGCSLADVARAFVIVERLYDVQNIWDQIESAAIAEDARLLLFDRLAHGLTGHMADIMRTGRGETIAETVNSLRGPIALLHERVDELLGDAAKAEAVKQIERSIDAGATPELAAAIADIYKIDGVAGIAHLASKRDIDPVAVARAFTALGSRLGLDWAQMTATRITPSDPWDRLLVSGLSRDFQQMRLDFLALAPGDDIGGFVNRWLGDHTDAVDRFSGLIARARNSPRPSISMLAQIAGQARILFSR